MAMSLSSTASTRAFTSVVTRASTTPRRVSVASPVVARRTVKKPAASSSGIRPVREDLYVEWGAVPFGGSYEDNVWPFGDWTGDKDQAEMDKIAEREIIHGRWAMLGCAGAWGAEVGTGIPWFQAGKVCTPEDCTHIQFPGEVIPLAPEGSGFPSFYNVLGGTVILMALSEGYRTGVTPLEPLYSELTVGDPYPGGEHFDPLGLVDKADLEFMKTAELKHARLAMISWLGYISQAVATNCDAPFVPSVSPAYIEGAKGPYANWQDHVAAPFAENVWKYWGLNGLGGQ